jgi:hypothetical protein
MKLFFAGATLAGYIRAREQIRVTLKPFLGLTCLAVVCTKLSKELPQGANMICPKRKSSCVAFNPSPYMNYF